MCVGVGEGGGEYCGHVDQDYISGGGGKGSKSSEPWVPVAQGATHSSG